MFNVTYNCYQIFVHHFSYNVTFEKLMTREVTEPTVTIVTITEVKALV